MAHPSLSGNYYAILSNQTYALCHASIEILPSRQAGAGGDGPNAAQYGKTLSQYKKDKIKPYVLLRDLQVQDPNMDHLTLVFVNARMAHNHLE